MKFGYFDDTRREYVITTPATPLPWINYLGSEDFFSLVSNTTGGYSFYRDARLRRLTRYRYNNSPLDSEGRRIYIKDGDTVLGKQTKVKVVKNKVAPPFRKAEFDIMFGEGISRSGEIMDLGVEYGIIKKSGSWFSYNDSKLGQGRDACKQIIQDNPELAEELEALIMQAMKEKKD